MATVKKCVSCDETKPLDGFHLDKKGTQGRRKECKACRNAKLKTKKPVAVEHVSAPEDPDIIKEHRNFDLEFTALMADKRKEDAIILFNNYQDKIYDYYHSILYPLAPAMLFEPSSLKHQDTIFLRSYIVDFLVKTKQYQDSDQLIKVEEQEDGNFSVTIPQEVALTDEEEASFREIVSPQGSITEVVPTGPYDRDFVLWLTHWLTRIDGLSPRSIKVTRKRDKILARAEKCLLKLIDMGYRIEIRTPEDPHLEIIISVYGPGDEVPSTQPEVAKNILSKAIDDNRVVKVRDCNSNLFYEILIYRYRRW
jgi:hypothetical protein